MAERSRADVAAGAGSRQPHHVTAISRPAATVEGENPLRPKLFARRTTSKVTVTQLVRARLTCSLKFCIAGYVAELDKTGAGVFTNHKPCRLCVELYLDEHVRAR